MGMSCSYQYQIIGQIPVFQGGKIGLKKRERNCLSRLTSRCVLVSRHKTKLVL